MSNHQSHLYAVILAGGSGTRLWPRSRRATPKQLLDLVTDRSMLQESYERITPLLPPTNVYVITNREYVDDVQRQLPYVPPAQIIGEPEGRGTAPPAALAAQLVLAHDPHATTLVLPADHVISDSVTFRKALATAADIAQDKFLVTLGVTPTYPETGYGYIEAMPQEIQANGQTAYRVARFLEKPNLETAQQFVERGNYYWNSGIFIWRADAILRAFEEHMPGTFHRVREIAAKGVDALSFQTAWAELDNQTLDYGIMEKASHVAMVPLNAGWSDLGSWAAIYDLMPRDDSENAVHGKHVGVNTKSSLIYGSKRLIATIGLEDVVIVDTDDAILIARKDSAQDVKKIVDELKKLRAEDYL